MSRETLKLIALYVGTLATAALGVIGWAMGDAIVGTTGFLAALCWAAMLRSARRQIAEWKGDKAQ